MGTIVVTGVTGRLGKEVMKALPKAVPFYREDFGIFPNPKLEDAEIIIHIAGSMKGELLNLYLSNYATTADLITCSPKLKKFIFVSTAVEGGDYSLSKRYAELLIKKSLDSYVILRPTMIIFKKDDRMLNKLMSLVKHLPIIPMPGDGKQLIQPVWYNDVVECIVKSIKGPKNKTYYVAGIDVMSMDMLIHQAAESLNKKIWILHLPKAMIHLNPFLTREEKARFFDDKIYDMTDTINDLKVIPTSFSSMLEEVEI